MNNTNKNRSEFEMIELLSKMTELVSSGASLDRTLDFVYENFKEYIPYNRIGCALIDDKKINVVAHWARSDRDIVINKGYSGILKDSSLQLVLDRNQPRILNDLEEYYKNHPHSKSTELIIKEGFCSSFTCPLILNDERIGFLFFTSEKKNCYQESHADLFLQISRTISFCIHFSKQWNTLFHSMQSYVEVLTELLQKSNKLAYEKSLKLAYLVDMITSSMEIENSWEFEAAAKLNYFGFIDAEESLFRKYESAFLLNDIEKENICELLESGIKTIEKIPHFSNITQMIRGQYLDSESLAKRYGEGDQSRVYLGSQILKIVTTYERLCRKEDNKQVIFHHLQSDPKHYDPAVVNALMEAISQVTHKKYVSIKELEDGMLLSDNIVDERGSVLISAGHIITSELTKKLTVYQEKGHIIKEPIAIDELQELSLLNN